MTYLVTSTGIGSKDVTYHVAKASIRKQWMLQYHTPHTICVAAYFRGEDEARQFAQAFGLTLTEHTS